MIKKYIEDEKASILLFLTVFIMYSLVYMTKNCYSAAMALIVEQGIYTKTQTGLISALFYLVYAAFQVVGGFLSDKVSPFKLIIIGLFGATISNILVANSNSYYFTLIVWCFNAIAQFGIWPSVFKICSSYLANVHRAKAVFYISFPSTIGLILSYLVAGFSSDYKTIFVISSVILLVMTIFMIFASKYFNSKLVIAKANDESMTDDKITYKSDDKNNDISFGKILLKSGYIILLPVFFVNTIFGSGIKALSPTFLMETYESVSASVASILNIIPLVIGFFGMFLIKYIYTHKKFNEVSALSLLFFISTLIISVMLFAGTISVWIIVTAISLTSFVTGMSGIVISSYISLHFAKYGKGGTISGITNAIAALAFASYNIVFTYIADYFGSWNVVVRIWVTIGIVACLISIIAIIPWKKFINKQKDL